MLHDIIKVPLHVVSRPDQSDKCICIYIKYDIYAYIIENMHRKFSN